MITCFVQVGSALAVDLTAAEEECRDAAVQVAVTSKGQICGITQRGAQGISPEYLWVSAILSWVVDWQMLLTDRHPHRCCFQWGCGACCTVIVPGAAAQSCWVLLLKAPAWPAGDDSPS